MMSNSYLLFSDLIKQAHRKYFYIFFGFSLLGILIGGTRSMSVVAFFILLVLLAKNIKQTISIVPVILIVLFLGQTSINSMISKSQFDIAKSLLKKPSDPLELLQETDYRTMMTGRVGIWQDVWKWFNKASVLQQIFGTGLTSNAHSSYFFLLLQIGWFGLAFYFLFHIRILMTLLVFNIPLIEKLIAIFVLMTVLLLGISLSAVIYTSFQWITYFLLGSILNIGLTTKDTIYLNQNS